MRNSYLRFAGIILTLTAGLPVQGQFVTKLQPQTLSEFEGYVKSAEAQLQERWQGKKNFLTIQDDTAKQRKVLTGEFQIEQLPNGQPVNIKDGLIHDWLGAVYFPHTSIRQVMDILSDFDRHKKIYPEIADSRTVQRNGNNLIGYWRLQRKGLVPVVLNVEQEAHYQQIAPDKWICRAYARNITEVDMSLFTRGRKFPPGEGHGYMWRLYAYWSLQSVEGGVLGECRTISLSRDVPEGLAWAVGPYVQKMPYESLLSTLWETRKALGY